MSWIFIEERPGTAAGSFELGFNGRVFAKITNAADAQLACKASFDPSVVIQSRTLIPTPTKMSAVSPASPTGTITTVKRR